MVTFFSHFNQISTIKYIIIIIIIVAIIIVAVVDSMERYLIVLLC